ncbi:MAG: ferrous iron transport protein B, partial [Eubacteriales bacterium]|nr:ferrous iron transport protein B [Eubacteriales bacterium]
MARTLGALKPGESGVVSAVGASDPHVKRRIVDMGITPMTEVLVQKVAPMGDPMEIHLRGYTLTIRQSDAAHIQLLDEQDVPRFREIAKKEAAARSARAGKLLSDDPANSDRPAHEGAARLTDWIITTPDSNSNPPTPFCSGDCRHCKKAQTVPEAPCVKAAVPDDQPVKLALVGNPNSGKTTLFNAMTGSHEYVGNWPGVTVEKKEGKLKAHGHDMTLVDLPGIYSLSPYSMEEVVARNFVIQEQPDAIINIVDATNLERNLYLTVQLMELERPMILALNMMDEVEKSGDKLDCRRLSLELGIPVVPISARTGEGVADLLQQCEKLISLVHAQMHRGFCIEPDDLYDDSTHAAHHRIGMIIGSSAEQAGLPAHWAEIKLLEGDRLVRDALALSPEQQQALDAVIADYVGKNALNDNETRVADSRYRYITQVVGVSLKRKLEAGQLTLSDRIDAILTNKYFALPLFFAIMLLIFTLTFGTVGAWLSDQVGLLIETTVSPACRALLTGWNASPWLISLLCDGIIAGVGGVLTFLPQIALLFLCLSILEDSGYMSRTAFIMDKAMRRFGLSGKSFIPLLMGFGCTVPATMGARTMENDKDRKMTILLLPFMSCSAKLPVYGLITGAFFSENQGLIVFALYALGIAVGIGTGLLFKRTLFRGDDAPFVMELPPYRRPTAANVLRHVGERVLHFLEKAGTIILVMSVVLWFLQNFSLSLAMVDNAEGSILGALGGFIAPALSPLGFGAWQAAVALLCGVVAKEAVVSSLSLFYGFSAVAGDMAVRSALSATFTPLSAFSFLVFVLLYTPCMAAVATMRRGLNSGK